MRLELDGVTDRDAPVADDGIRSARGSRGRARRSAPRARATIGRARLASACSTRRAGRSCTRPVTPPPGQVTSQGLGSLHENLARAEALDDAGRDVAAGDHAARPGPDAAAIDVVALVLAVRAAEGAARDGVVAVDGAVVAARRRSSRSRRGTSRPQPFAAHAAAVDHVVAEQIAAVAVRAALVAVGAVGCTRRAGRPGSSRRRRTSSRAPRPAPRARRRRVRACVFRIFQTSGRIVVDEARSFPLETAGSIVPA